jgi:uracil-DNA glycosylase family 4
MNDLQKKINALNINLNNSPVMEIFGYDTSGKKVSKSKKKPKSDSGDQRHLMGMSCVGCPNTHNSKKLSGPHGLGQKEILVVTSEPFSEEVKTGVWYSGAMGDYLFKTFKQAGINIYEDCWRVNALGCKSKDDILDEAYEKCSPRLMQSLETLKPKVIVCMDEHALQAILHTQYLSKIQITQGIGRFFPDHKHNCWVLCAYPINFIMCKEFPSLLQDPKRAKKPSDVSVKSVFISRLQKINTYINKKLPEPFSVELGEDHGNILLNSFVDCKSYFRAITDKPNLLIAFDYETTGLSPFEKGSRVVTVSFSQDPSIGVCVPIGNNKWTKEQQIEINGMMSKWLSSCTPKCLQNYNFECVWSKEKYGEYPNNMVHDIFVGSHVLYCSPGSASLAFQVYHNFGAEYKTIVDVKRIAFANLEDVARYNCLDSRYTLAIARIQKQLMEEQDLYGFFKFLSGTQETLGEMAYDGVQIHYPTYVKIKKLVTSEHSKAYKQLMSLACVDYFKEKQHKKFNPNSELDKAAVLYDILGIVCTEFTDTGRSVSEITLGKIVNDWPEESPQGIFINSLMSYAKIDTFFKLVKTYETYMQHDHKVHSEYTLDVTGTYRSSSRNPNMQNAPKRKPGIRIFRQCIEVCNDDEILLEVDYSGAELSGIAMISKDPVLTQEVIDKVNIHKFWSAKVFAIDLDLVTKDQRQTGKNSFVFPSFYGAGAPSIAYAMSKPIKFIEDVQSGFWKHYARVKEWQNEVLETYKKVGGVRGATGFFRPGPLSTEKLFNTPIQGTTFHLLLDALPRIRAEFKRRGLSAKLKIQVHDSILIKCLLTEVPEVVKIVTDIMCSERFDFQKGVPLSVEWEYGKNWGQMSELNHVKVIETGSWKIGD